MKFSKIVIAAALVVASRLSPAQQPALFLSAAAPTAPAPQSLTVTPKPADNAERPLTGRWLDLTTFSHSERYRNQYSDGGYHYFENGQERSLLAGRIKLDAQGKYAIGFRGSSGRTFNWSYSDYAGKGFAARLKDPNADNDVIDLTDPAIASAAAADPQGASDIQNIQSTGWQFFLRDLYFSATPTPRLTLQFGSFSFERGLSSEITTFDDDGYLTGERLRIKDPKHLFFDEVTLTSAYFGSFYQPSIFQRGGTFSKSNYRQIVGKKQLSKRVAISGEYNWISLTVKTNTTREAIVVDTHESKIFDRVRLEAYERLSHVNLQGDDNAARQGFALVGEKTFHKLTGDFGVASIDRDYGLYSGSSFAQEIGFSMNGDNYNVGIRIFSHLSYKLTPYLTAFGFYTRITGDQFSNLDRQGLNAGVTFDLKALANSRKRVF